VSAFSNSTVVKRLNNGNYTGAAEALTWWNKAGSKVVNGLVNRRADEKKLFLTPFTKPHRETQIKDLLEEYTKKLMEIYDV
jgi:hypothetical protein